MGYFSSIPHNEDSCRELAERVIAYAESDELASMDVAELAKRYLANVELFKLHAQSEDDADDEDDRTIED
mgnify:CR=1 FL=1